MINFNAILLEKKIYYQILILAISYLLLKDKDHSLVVLQFQVPVCLFVTIETKGSTILLLSRLNPVGLSVAPQSWFRQEIETIRGPIYFQFSHFKGIQVSYFFCSIQQL